MHTLHEYTHMCYTQTLVVGIRSVGLYASDSKLNKRKKKALTIEATVQKSWRWLELSNYDRFAVSLFGRADDEQNHKQFQLFLNEMRVC